MPSNNSKITRAQRDDILQTYVRGEHASAQAKARQLNLNPDYAYRLAVTRGLVPRIAKRWGTLREIKAVDGFYLACSCRSKI
jgi:hypothetical protein